MRRPFCPSIAHPLDELLAGTIICVTHIICRSAEAQVEMALENGSMVRFRLKGCGRGVAILRLP